MLGILLAILKFIGWLLLGILAVVFILLAVVLFVPIVYELFGEKKARMRGRFRVSWLFGLIQIKGMFDEKKGTKIFVRILGRNMSEGKKRHTKKKKNKDAVALTSRENAKEKSSSVTEAVMPKVVKSEQEGKAPKEVIPMKIEEKEQEIRIRRVKLSEIKEVPLADEDIIFTHTETEKETTADGAEVEEGESGVVEKARGAWKQWQEVVDKKGVFLALKKLIVRLIKAMTPKTFRLSGIFGTGDPETTGYLMALFGIFVTKFGDAVAVKGDFAKAVLEDAEIEITGKIRLGAFMYASIAFIMTKSIRRIWWRLWKGRSKKRG